MSQMSAGIFPRDSPLTILKRKSIYLGVASAAIVAGSYFVLSISWSPRIAARWLPLTAGGLVYLFFLVRRLLPLNQRPGLRNEVLPDLGLGTLLTISRGVLVSMLAGFLITPWPAGWLVWLPAVLYWLGNLTDFLDGYIARRTNYETRLGEALDMALDGYGVLVAAILVVRFGQVPLWYLPVGLARYLFVLGIWLRRRAGKSVFPLPPSVRRRAFAGLQMGFLGVMLMPLFTPPGTYWAAAVFSLMFLAGFLVDWLYIAGAVSPEAIRQLIQSNRVPIQGALLILRMFTAGLVASMVWTRLAGFGLMQSSPMDAVSAFLSNGWGWAILVDTSLLILLLTGFAGRLSALAVLLLQGFYQLASPLGTPQLLLILASGGVFFLGTGPFSLWTPEDRLIYRRAGEV